MMPFCWAGVGGSQVMFRTVALGAVASIFVGGALGTKSTKYQD